MQVVGPAGGDLVVVYKGVARESYSCSPECSPRMTLGDDNKYFTDPRVVTTAKAVGVGYVPGVLHYNDMVNSDSSPWIQMLQTAIFDGDVDGAIKTARDAMEQIASQ